MEPREEIFYFLFQFGRCAIVVNHIVGLGGLLRNWHLSRQPGLGLCARVAARRHHPRDLRLLFRHDAAYYIKIFLPVRFEEERDDGEA